jgi:hypothetical protein
MKTVTKVADGKGRIALGNKYAGRTFIVQELDEKIILNPAVTIPASEAWLYENKEALASVGRGLQEAQNGNFSRTPPNLAADETLIAEIDD